MRYPPPTPKLIVTGDVLLFVGGNCALAFFQNLKIAYSRMENHEVSVRAGLEQFPSSSASMALHSSPSTLLPLFLIGMIDEAGV